MNRPQHAHRSAVPPRRRRLLSVTRSLAAVALSVVLYFLLPLDRDLDTGGAIAMAVTLVLFAGAVAWQVRAITRSAYPKLRAAETLATAGPIFLLIFATAYVLLHTNQEDAFSQTLSRTDALYFTITVFATVGFGDITPVTQTARVLTMVQMLADLVLVGLIARLVLGAVQVAEEGQQTHSDSTGAGEPDR
ncbi:two pore domain potassium channel family protein [Streptomyces ipomoeae]|uniref:Two pore domain potassium channel family protein n=1 Tax=Streptomyces ipomoeae TaxID=103232 RepID=A0AAE8W7W3_9ACTN|nr:potassium channel family protein [Streptomyces ipomoeae]TQE37512.1 two pore domain potassium channel family protein [Streptomyces ipomoeae]